MPGQQRTALITNFAGGVNTKDDIQSIANNQLSKGTNVVITRDGSIQNRNGIHLLDNVADVSGTYDTYRMLGVYGNNIIFSTEDWTIGQTQAIYACNAKVINPAARSLPNGGINPASGVYTTNIPVGSDYPEGRVLKALPYLDSLILVHELGFVRSVSYTGMADLIYPGSSTTGSIPGGPAADAITNQQSIVIWKDRLFLASWGGKVYYSAATDLVNFNSPAGGYFVVGDEPTNEILTDFSINQLLVVGDVMYIFTDTRVYTFTFQTDPAVDGYLRAVSMHKGAQKAILWNNRIFVADTYGVYEFGNGVFNKISSNMDFYTEQTGSNRTCGALFIFDNYLIARYSSDYLCMNLLNGAWSHWHSSIKLQNMHSIVVEEPSFYGAYVSFYGDTEDHKKSLVFMSAKTPKYDTITEGTAGAPDGSYGTPGTAYLDPPSIVTKMFAFDSPWAIKKIYKILIDRGGNYSASPAPSQGWRVVYYKADNTSQLITYPAGDNRFGRLVLGGAFRCYHFKVMYDLSYASTPAADFDFNINSLSISFKSGSDYGKSDGTFIQ